MLKATHTELGIIRGVLADMSYDSIRIFLRKKKWNHLYQNIFAVMEALTPGCRPTFTEENLAEIKRVFEEMGFEGSDQKGVHKSDYIWTKIQPKLTLNFICFGRCMCVQVYGVCA